MRTKFNFLCILGFLICMVSASTAQAQSAAKLTARQTTSSEAEKARVAKQLADGEARIAQIDWVEKMKTLDAQQIERLEKWQQFPLRPLLKQNPAVSREELENAIRIWFNEKPADRAKVLMSL